MVSSDIDEKSDAVRGFCFEPSSSTSVTYGPVTPRPRDDLVARSRVDAELPVARRLRQELLRLLDGELVRDDVVRDVRALVAPLEVRPVRPTRMPMPLSPSGIELISFASMAPRSVTSSCRPLPSFSPSPSPK
jgi:hypothetical protein